MLSTVHRLNGNAIGYKATHRNHPCTIWAGQSLSNWRWLKALGTGLHNEWKYRYGHGRNVEHKSYQVMADMPDPSIPDIGLTPFAQAMPEEFQDADPVRAYRRYYREHKVHLHKWTKRPRPWWLGPTPGGVMMGVKLIDDNTPSII